MVDRFSLYLIKPSHYDDDGYVIQWFRSAIPSNTLAVMHGLSEDCLNRRILGADVDIEIEVMDETNTRVRPERIADRIAAGGGRGLVCLVGVQSNQFPRSLDIARPLRAAGVQPEQLLGLLAWSSGLRDTTAPVRATELLAGFSLDRLRHEPFVFTDAMRRALEK